MIPFTIITVCYNAQATIKETIVSVFNQTFQNYEYIIIDGNSEDRTVEIAKQFVSIFKNSGGYRVFSERDTGIYNAMNKGVKMASGQYIIFMNAGDKFFDKNALSEVYEKIVSENYPDILYGRTVFSKYGLFFEMLNGRFQDIPNGMPFGHTSSFCKSELLLQNPFDEQFRIAADYDFFSKMFDMKKTSIKMDCFISIFDNSGISSVNEVGTRLETSKVRFLHGYISDSEYQQIISREDSPKDEQEQGSFFQKIKNILIPYRIRKMRGIRIERKRLMAHGWTKNITEIK